MVFGNGVKNIQAAAYNGARTVDINLKSQFLIKTSYHIVPSPSTPLLSSEQLRLELQNQRH